MYPDPHYPSDWFWRAVRWRYAQFTGRARRTEFWWYQCVWWALYLVLIALDHLLGTFSGAYGGGHGLFSTVFALALLLPSVAVAVRRLHDTDKSAWWLLIGLVPVVGWIGLLIFYLQPGDVGANPFGPDPKHGVVDEGIAL